MFNFFRKKEQPKKVEAEDNPIRFRSEEALMENPSFSLLLQLNQETGEYIFAIDALDKSVESAEMAATLICNLVHSELNPVLIESFKNYAESNAEQFFVEATLSFWKEYELQILQALQQRVNESEKEKEKKRKIDPTKIFNIRGEKNE